jgi:hypothetical protein
VRWRLGPVAAIGIHMESKAAYIDRDWKDRIERCIELCGPRKRKYE